MKQKIVIKVPMKNGKDRSKAMKIAVGFTGVNSVHIGGEDKDFVAVTGDEVDAVTLAQLLIKKFGGGTLVRVEPLMLHCRFYQEYDEVGQSLSIYQGNPSFNNKNNEVLGFQALPNSYKNPDYYPPPTYPYYYAYQAPVNDSSCSIM